jgi:hypothetical protein
VLLVLSLRAQTSAASGPLSGDGTPTNEVHANPDEVLIDLVVRDKRNKPVTNLSPADIKVSDAGNPVQLADLHLVTPESGSATTIALLFVLPQTEMLPKNFACFCPKSDVDCDENLSTVRTFLQDTCAGW